MILVAGGTGNLGQHVVQLLRAQGEAVRILTRDTAQAKHLWNDDVEIVAGDVLDLSAVTKAVAGVQTVISAIHGFSGRGIYNPHTVDQQGNNHLIQAAGAAGVEHFILISIQGAASDHPLELFRMKYVAEQEVRANTLPWTIIRPTAFMETWAKLVGEPLVMSGATRIFGRGQNPINFVSVYDVARFAVLAVVDPTMRGTIIEVGGPENLTMQQFVRTFETVTGKSGKKHSVPLLMMRLMATLMRPLNPMLARQIEAGVVMDTRDMSFDSSDTFRRYPAITPTRLAEVVQRDYGASG
jgi:NADH dehydrogenase